MKGLSTFLIMLLFSVGICLAGEKVDLKEKKDKISYSIGYQVAGDFKRQAIEIRPDLLIMGIQDALTEGETQLTMEEMRTALTELQKRAEGAPKGQ